MMQVYYMRVSWVSGIAFFIAFLLTFWPTRNRMIVAAVLWMIGMVSVTGLSGYDVFLRGAIAYGFSASGSFPLLAWLISLFSIILATVESAYLFPWVSQERALRAGRVLFLAIVPAFVLLTTLLNMRGPIVLFPLGTTWLAYPLLWFRVRENLK